MQRELNSFGMQENQLQTTQAECSLFSKQNGLSLHQTLAVAEQQSKGDRPAPFLFQGSPKVSLLIPCSLVWLCSDISTQVLTGRTFIVSLRNGGLITSKAIRYTVLFRLMIWTSDVMWSSYMMWYSDITWSSDSELMKKHHTWLLSCLLIPPSELVPYVQSHSLLIINKV